MCFNERKLTARGLLIERPWMEIRDSCNLSAILSYPAMFMLLINNRMMNMRVCILKC